MATPKLINCVPFSPFLLHFTRLGLVNEKLIAMDNMRIRISGSLSEIKSKDPALIKEWDQAIAKENAKESQLR